MKKHILVLFIFSLFFTSLLGQTLYKIGNNSNGALVSPFKNDSIIVKGKINIVTFSMYFKYCTPCVNEINLLNKRILESSYKNKIVFKVITSVSEKSLALAPFLLAFAEEKKWLFTILMDTDFTYANANNISSFPITFLTNKNGEIVHMTKAGFNEEETKKLFDKILEIETK